MFDDYISKKIMRYASGDTEDLNRVKQQMTMEAITQGTAEHVMIDVTKMREILLNILSNALKYTPTGNSVTMTVTELPSEREGYAVYQTIIEDTGIGMSEEFLSHMFEYFSRERTTTESGVSGTGLGTAIVKKLVDLMHGTIDVESKLGEGRCRSL